MVKYATNREAVADSKFDYSGDARRLEEYLMITRQGNAADPSSLIHLIEGNTGDAYLQSTKNSSLSSLSLSELQRQALSASGIGSDESYNAWLDSAYGAKPAPASGQVAGSHLSPTEAYAARNPDAGEPVFNNTTNPTRIVTLADGTKLEGDSAMNYGKVSSATLEPQSQIDYNSPPKTTSVNLGALGGIDYTFRVGQETIEQYNARIAKAREPAGGITSGGSTGSKGGTSGGSGGSSGSNYTTDTSSTSLTGSQTQVQKMIEEIMKQNNIVAGKEEYQAKQEDVYNIPELAKLQKDLASQLQISQLEAANIQAETQTGQGVTSAIDQRQRAEKLRLNSVKSLQIYAQMQMADGNLQAAQGAVDRAVEAKYGPLEAQIKAATANVSLIMNSPLYTEQEKKQAQAQLDVQNAKQAAIDEKKQNERDLKVALLDQMMKYPDAGIDLDDTLEEANSKIKSNSRIYAENVRPPQYITNPTDSSTPGDNEQLYNGLSSKTATAVRSKVSQFKSEPQVQNFATIQDGYNFASSLSTDTKNPADDQALIYSLAKALDPGSVVREGEYATAQKYAQSWIQAYGKGVTQALAGTGFLSTAARENIKATLAAKYNSTKVTYDNLYNQYTQGVNNLTGRTDGGSFLTDYANSPSAPMGEDAAKKEVMNYISLNPAYINTVNQAFKDNPTWTYADVLQLLP